MWQIGGLECAAEDCDGMILCSNIVERLGSAELRSVHDILVHMKFRLRTTSPPMAAVGCLALVLMTSTTMLAPRLPLDVLGCRRSWPCCSIAIVEMLDEQVRSV